MDVFKDQHRLGEVSSGSSLRIEDGHIRASTRLGSTDLSISVPISTVVQTVRGLLS
jgi:hypothetical protein